MTAMEAPAPLLVPVIGYAVRWGETATRSDGTESWTVPGPEVIANLALDGLDLTGLTPDDLAGLDDPDGLDGLLDGLDLTGLDLDLDLDNLNRGYLPGPPLTWGHPVDGMSNPHAHVLADRATEFRADAVGLWCRWELDPATTPRELLAWLATGERGLSIGYVHVEDPTEHRGADGVVHSIPTWLWVDHVALAVPRDDGPGQLFPGAHTLRV